MTKKIIDYSKTVIYKIVSNDLNIKEVYVGSTTNFTKRKCQHKSSCNNINDKKYNYKLYQFIRANGGWNSFSMIEIEKYICSDGNESRAKERQWFEQLNAQLNMVCPGAYVNGKKEYIKIYKETNKEEIKQYYKIYNETNKDKINEQRNVPYLCQCGCTITKRNKASHQKSQKHINLMEKLKTDDVLII